jgi:hypothetical protein
MRDRPVEKTDNKARCAIRTLNPTKKAAADSRLRPLGLAAVFGFGVILYFTISGYFWVRTLNILDNMLVCLLTPEDNYCIRLPKLRSR